MQKTPTRSYEPLRAWVLQNRGIQSQIARSLEVSRQHVRGVLAKRFYSDGGLIESILEDLGAPGMTERRKEAEVKTRGRQWTKAEIKRLMFQLRKIQAGRKAA